MSAALGPLSGIRVLEAGIFAAGPACGAVLADWGAEVIKIEPPSGERARKPGEADKSGAATNPRHDLHNRGKLGIALDLKSTDGQQVLHRLAQRADVFVTNLRPRALARLGTDYATLSAVAPRLVYGQIVGYAADSPFENRPSYDHGAFWSESGAAALYTAGDEEPPQPSGGMGDRVAGSMLAGGIAAALLERTRTGVGRHLSVSLLATGLWMIGSDASDALQLGEVQHGPRRNGAPHPLLNCYRTRDRRWLWLTAMDMQRHWADVARVTEAVDMHDKKYQAGQPAAVGGHTQELTGVLDAAFARRTAAEWARRLDDADVPYGLVRTVGEALESPAARDAGVFLSTSGTDPDQRVINTPCQFDGQARGPVTPSPRTGADSDAVLAAAGFTEAEIAELRRAHAVA